MVHRDFSTSDKNCPCFIFFKTTLSSVLAVAQDPTVTITESDPEAKLSDTGFNQGGLNGGLIEVKRDLDVTMSCYVENKQIDTLVSSKVGIVSALTVRGIFGTE